MGDPGFSHHPGAAEGTAAAGGSSVWWSSEGELLSAPKRNNGRGVNYTRSAKQVRLAVEWRGGGVRGAQAC